MTDSDGMRADADLDKVDHVVVMMLENRSFDHMLGYLSLTGGRPEIDGLRPKFANSWQGRSYPVHHLGTTAVQMDPDHSSAAIDTQIAGGAMSGAPPRPAIWGNSSPGTRRGPPRPGTPWCAKPRPGPRQPRSAGPSPARQQQRTARSTTCNNASSP